MVIYSSVTLWVAYVGILAFGTDEEKEPELYGFGYRAGRRDVHNSGIFIPLVAAVSFVYTNYAF